MLQITPFVRWLEEQVEAVGWTAALRRANGRFTAGALQGWLRGSIPGPANQTAIAAVFNADMETIKALVYESWAMQEAASDRPTSTGRRPGSRSRLPGRSAKRKLAVALLAAASAWAALEPLPVAGLPAPNPSYRTRRPPRLVAVPA